MSEIMIDIGHTKADYKKFLQCKKLPRYDVKGRTIYTDSVSYSQVFGGKTEEIKIDHSPHLLDFQSIIAERTLALKRYAAFLDCGLGKTAISLAFANSLAPRGRVLILCPLSVYEQFHRENKRWYGSRLIDLRKGESWTDGIAILNYENRKKLNMDGVIGVVLDESSILKNDTGETRNHIIETTKNVEYKLMGSATPAPNDHDEYSSHAVFAGLVKTSKEFYAKFFVKNNNRWELKGHAQNAFYHYLSTWATYIIKPSELGYESMTEMPVEPEYIYQKCGYEAKKKSLALFQTADNQKDRSFIFGELRSNPKSERTKKIVDFINQGKGLIWCARNKEEAMFKKLLDTDAVVVNGSMPVERRVEIVDEWRSGNIKHLISKPSVLGFGINLPECSHMAYSGFTYSFEQFYQAVRRSHRYGREGRLKVLVPYTFPERPILSSLRRKLDTFDRDSMKIQALFNKEGK